MSSEEAALANDEEIKQVDDETEKEKNPIPVVYDISSYGADYDVSGLITRLRNGDIIVPTFQRAYVWTQDDASRFIESLLLGLPIPGVFFATEKKTNKLLVIDGQQRLKSLLFFYDGFFDPKPGEERKKVFKLIDVESHLKGATYESLGEKERRRLDNAIIHATIIKQESPREDDTGIYHVFHRLNAGGLVLKPQEIRRAAFHGMFLEKITEINSHPQWRTIFGKKNRRLKDEELILRFLALYFESEKYKKPMEEFLNSFASNKQKTASPEFLAQCESVFKRAIEIVHSSIKGKPFRILVGINAALFDSVMVGIARRLETGPITDYVGCQKAYEELLANQDFIKSIKDGTSDEATVALRLNKATEKFSQVK